MLKELETQKTRSCWVLILLRVKNRKPVQFWITFDVQLKIVLFPYRPCNASHISWEM